MDWRKIIGEIIIKHELKQGDIADLVGVTQVTISNLYNRKIQDPIYRTGSKLLDLHKAKTVQQFKEGK